MNKLLALICIAMASALASPGAEIRVSLLDDADVLADTGLLLVQNGSSVESVEAFEKAVRYHKTDLFDISHFPERESGYYRFGSVEELDKSLPDPFCCKVTTNDIAHNSLVCLDVVVLLIKDTGAKAARLKENFAAKYFAKQKNLGSRERPEYSVDPVTAFSFYQDGHTLLYPTNGYNWITGLTRTANDVDLAVSLKAGRLLPGQYESTDQAIQKLFATWSDLLKKDGLTFPEKIQVVSAGYVPMRYRYWETDHVAVCFKNHGKLVYLEKNGMAGPYLRVDFNDEKELGEFVASKLVPPGRDPLSINFQAPIFVAINDRLICIKRP